MNQASKEFLNDWFLIILKDPLMCQCKSYFYMLNSDPDLQQTPPSRVRQ
jgi:hypothetical protein